MPAETLAAQAPAAHTPKYKRLTQQQQLAILQLDKLGKTQTEIAQVIGCDQTSVSRWLAQCADSTVEATAYLRGRALQVAQNAVRNNSSVENVAILKGVNVLTEAQSQGLSIYIGGQQQDVKILTLTATSRSDEGAS